MPFGPPRMTLPRVAENKSLRCDCQFCKGNVQRALANAGREAKSPAPSPGGMFPVVQCLLLPVSGGTVGSSRHPRNAAVLAWGEVPMQHLRRLRRALLCTRYWVVC